MGLWFSRDASPLWQKGIAACCRNDRWNRNLRGDTFKQAESREGKLGVGQGDDISKSSPNATPPPSRQCLLNLPDSLSLGRHFSLKPLRPLTPPSCPQTNTEIYQKASFPLPQVILNATFHREPFSVWDSLVSRVSQCYKQWKGS